MHISDFEMLRNMAKHIEYLDRRVLELNNLLLTGTFRHRYIFPVQQGKRYLMAISEPDNSLLFASDEVEKARLIFTELRDRAQSEVARVREKFAGALSNYTVKTSQPG